MKLYVCLTYYHTLITLVKALVNHEKYDLCLSNNIANYVELRERLEKTDCFGQVYEYDAVRLTKENKVYKSKVVEIFTKKLYIRKHFKEYCKFDIRNYEVYLYHDKSFIGMYLVQEGIRYHLIEDALDYFKYFDEYYNVDAGSYTKGTIKFWLKEKLGIGYRLWGTSPYCIDIEVNDKNGIKISSDKVFEVPRKQLFGRLNAEQKRFVYNTYAEGKAIAGTLGKCAILFTQPLFKANHVPTMNAQMNVFDALIREFVAEGYHVVLKPHPRDGGDYSTIVSRYKCGFIDKNLPSEILNYNPEARYDVAVSITSTAINFLEYADQKIFMGMEFVKEVLDNADKGKA